MEVVNAVRGDGQVVGLGDVGDLEPGRDAAHVRDVGLGERDAAGVDQALELVDRAEVLARGDGQPAVPQDPHVPGNVVRDRRLLQPEDVVRAERAGGADRLVGRPAHVRVDHERHVGPETLPHRADALDVLAEAWAAHLHLDRAEASAEVLLGLAEEPIERELEVDAAGVGLDPRMVAPEELPEREPRGARGDPRARCPPPRSRRPRGRRVPRSGSPTTSAARGPRSARRPGRGAVARGRRGAPGSPRPRRRPCRCSRGPRRRRPCGRARSPARSA